MAVSEGSGLAFGDPKDPTADGPLSNLRFAPPFPGSSRLPPATVPAPPLLDPSKSPLALARTLLSAYRGAYQSRYGKPCFILARGDLERSRFFPLLVGAARSFVEHSIPPAAWCAWSLDVWRKGHDTSPTLSFVFNSRWISQRRGWFRRDASSYVGGLALYGRAHRALLEAWFAMADALYRAPSDAIAEEIVERHFPGRRYDELVAAARREVAETMRRMQDAVEREVWLWG